jgi:hypothetical protein
MAAADGRLTCSVPVGWPVIPKAEWPGSGAVRGQLAIRMRRCACDYLICSTAATVRSVRLVSTSAASLRASGAGAY